MAKERTKKSRYESRFSKSYVTAAQYITELICEKYARCNGHDLVQEFWKKPEWAKHYRAQIPSAYTLLKKYDAAAIILALQAKEAWNIYSLRAPHLIPLIEREQVTVTIKKENLMNAKPLEVATGEVTFRKEEKKKSAIDKLEELEND